MSNRELLQKEIDSTDEGTIDEVLGFIRMMKARNADPIVEPRLSEALLAREWMLPEEEAWASL